MTDRVDYNRAAWKAEGGMFITVKPAKLVTKQTQIVPGGVAIWLREGGPKGVTGAMLLWSDVIRLALHAALHNPAARADLRAALAEMPIDEAAEEVPRE